MERYYYFDGDTLVYLGEFNSLGAALDCENNEEGFYTASAAEWERVVGNMSKTLKLPASAKDSSIFVDTICLNGVDTIL